MYVETHLHCAKCWHAPWAVYDLIFAVEDEVIALLNVTFYNCHGNLETLLPWQLHHN